MLLSFCLEMGFSSVVLVGHDDGGLLVLKAAERVRASTCSARVSPTVAWNITESYYYFINCLEPNYLTLVNFSTYFQFKTLV